MELSSTIHRVELEKHLKILRRERLIEDWHARKIRPGDEIRRETDKHLEAADIVLFLISSDFIDSEYLNSVELKRALERFDDGDALVIPILLRDCLWERTPLGKLQPLPSNRIPVMASSWKSIDEAFTSIAHGIEDVVSGRSERK